MIQDSLFDLYWSQLKYADKTADKILYRFYNEYLGVEPNVSVLVMISNLVKLYSKELVFRGIINLATSLADHSKANFGLLKYYIEREKNRVKDTKSVDRTNEIEELRKEQEKIRIANN